MLSAIGLTLDLVGAVALVLGLFGHARPLSPGENRRAPDRAAHDLSFGLVGLLFLPSGFILQALTYFDIVIESSPRAAAVAAGLTLVAGSAAAWLLYGLSYIVLQRREVRHVRREFGEHIEGYPMRTFRLGFRFWRGEADA